MYFKKYVPVSFMVTFAYHQENESTEFRKGAD